MDSVVVSTFIGSSKGYKDGVGKDVAFSSPYQAVLDPVDGKEFSLSQQY